MQSTMLELIAAVWRWKAPKGVEMSLSTMFDRRSMSIFLYKTGSPVPPLMLEVLPSSTPTRLVEFLDAAALAVLEGKLTAVPSPTALTSTLDAAGEAFLSAVANAGRRSCGGCDSL